MQGSSRFPASSSQPHIRTVTSLVFGHIDHTTTNLKGITNAMPLDKFPPLNCKAHLPAWIARVEKDLKAGGIPRSQWADTAILFLAGYEPLNKLMRQVQARRKEAGRFAGLNMWTWKDFKESLSQVLGKVPT